MIAVIFHRMARREAQSAEAWYTARNQVAANNFRVAIETAAHRIAMDPDSYTSLGREYRYVPVKGFPYTLIYRRKDASTVIIVAVAHTSRRPRYWRRRK